MRYSEMKVIEMRRESRLAHLRLDSGAMSAPAIGWRIGGIVLALGLLLALAACGSSTVYRDQAAPMTTNGPVDLERYQGLWYEIARFPNSFEEGCVGVTAEYTLNADGTVKVLNTCRQGSLDGPVETAEGVATSVSPDNDRLEVTFVPWLPFARGDYWILQTDYQVAVIGNPAGTTGWILARTPVLPDIDLKRGFAVLQKNGYDISQITVIEQQQ